MLRILYVVRIQIRQVSRKLHVYFYVPLRVKPPWHCLSLFFRSLLLFMWSVVEMLCPLWEKVSQRAQFFACFTYLMRWWPRPRTWWEHWKLLSSEHLLDKECVCLTHFQPTWKCLFAFPSQTKMIFDWDVS